LIDIDFRQIVRTAAVFLALACAARGAQATVVPFMSLEEMTREAGVIVVGSVETTESRFSADGRMILTEVAVTVERPLKGGPRARILLVTPGGRVGDKTLIASGAPVFARGERVVLFLHGDEGRPFGIVGWNQGKLMVSRDPRTGRDLVRGQAAGVLLLDRQGHPVEPGRQGAGPVELGDFVRQIEAILTAPQGKAAKP